nr:reverse transcriptase domain-containing protein [Tanacetum cinerariifolium]
AVVKPITMGNQEENLAVVKPITMGNQEENLLLLRSPVSFSIRELPRRTLPGNTVTNPKEELKGITTRSGVAYQGPKTPSPSKQGTKTSRALIDIYKGELTLRIGNEAITYNLDQTVRYSANYIQMTANKIDVVESACEEYSQEVLNFLNVIDSGTSTPQNDLIVFVTSPTLTPFEDSDFLLFEEA